MDIKQLEPLLFIVAIFVVFYLLLIRPQQKKRREMQQMQTNLAPGTEIVTTAGMYAKVVRVEADDTLLVEVAPGVTCRYMKQAIMRVIPDEQPAVAPAPDADAKGADAVDAADAGAKDTDATGTEVSDAAPGEKPATASDADAVAESDTDTPAGDAVNGKAGGKDGSTAVDPAKGDRSS